MPKHEFRLGVDVVNHQLNHFQAESGDYGVRGGLSFSGNTTGAPGYVALAWNQYAAFLMGLSSFFSKDTQTEEMTGREWQTAVYLRDRWNVNQKLTQPLPPHDSRAESRTLTGVPRRLHHLIAAMLCGLAALLTISAYL